MGIPVLLKVKSANEAFVEGLKVLEAQQEVSPRGMKTREVQPMIIYITDPYDRIISHPVRKMNYTFLSMEPIWILSGSEKPWIVDHLKNMSKFTDPDPSTKEPVLMGAYGPRIRHFHHVDQLKFVVETLKKDPDSRRATTIISYPPRDTQDYKDIACTCLFQFMIRNGALEMTVYMRSNDIWLGFCYDVFTFSLIQHMVAGALSVPVGSYVHVANSFHIYEPHFEKAKEVIKNPSSRVDIPIPTLDGDCYNSLDEVYADAAWGQDLLGTGQCPSNNRYISKLLRYVLEKSNKFVKSD